MEQEHTPTTPTLNTEGGKTKDSSLAIPLAIIFAGALIAGAIIFTDTPTQLAQNNNADGREGTEGIDVREIPEKVFAIKEDDHVLGNPKAELILIEYSDLECPFCERFHSTMLEVMETYGKTGELAWVYRHFPLSNIHPNAQKQAEGSECAAELGGNDAFWKFGNTMFELMKKGTPAGSSGIVSAAESAGIDKAAFTTCLESGKYKQRVERDFAEGVEAGVRGTPFSVVYNTKTKKHVSINGAYPYDNVKALIESVK